MADRRTPETQNVDGLADTPDVAKWAAVSAVVAAVGAVQLGLFSSCVLPLFKSFAGAPYVPMGSGALRALFERALPRACGSPSLKGLRLIDMGSGDGRVVLEAARCGMHAMGWELNPVLVAVSRTSALREGVGGDAGGSAQFRTVNFWDESASLREADIVTFYALPELCDRLREKLVEELPEGAVAVSHRFPVVAWSPLFVQGADDDFPLYAYDVHAAERQRAQKLRTRQK